MTYRCREPRHRPCDVCGIPYPARHPRSFTCSETCRFVRVWLRAWLRNHKLSGLRRDRAKARIMGLMNHLWHRS